MKPPRSWFKWFRFSTRKIQQLRLLRSIKMWLLLYLKFQDKSSLLLNFPVLKQQNHRFLRQQYSFKRTTLNIQTKSPPQSSWRLSSRLSSFRISTRLWLSKSRSWWCITRQTNRLKLSKATQWRLISSPSSTRRRRIKMEKMLLWQTTWQKLPKGSQLLKFWQPTLRKKLLSPCNRSKLLNSLSAKSIFNTLW